MTLARSLEHLRKVFELFVTERLFLALIWSSGWPLKATEASFSRERARTKTVVWLPRPILCRHHGRLLNFAGCVAERLNSVAKPFMRRPWRGRFPANVYSANIPPKLVEVGAICECSFRGRDLIEFLGRSLLDVILKKHVADVARHFKKDWFRGSLLACRWCHPH